MENSQLTSKLVTAAKVGLLGSGIGAAATAAAYGLGITSSSAIAPVVIVLFLLIASGHYWKTWQAEISSQQTGVLRQLLEDMIAETQGHCQLIGTGLPYPLPFGSKYALTADAAAVLARQVALIKPRVVIEFGSGVSTILVARLLKNMGGGQIFSIDHESEWAGITRKHVEAAGLQDIARVLDAPLGKQQFEGEEFLWYQLPPEVSQIRDIDLMIVDGPPKKTDPEGIPRYPALPVMSAQLSAGAEIFVDDAARKSEQEMVRRWCECFPEWQARMLATVRGTCLLTRKQLENENQATV